MKASRKSRKNTSYSQKMSYQNLENRCLLAGDFVWAHQFGGTGVQSGTAVAADAFGNVYTLGAFSGTVDLDPGSGVSNVTATGSFDAFLTKVNSSGALVWAKTFGGTGTMAPNAIAIDGSGALLISGSFGGTADFDPGAGVTNFSATSTWNGFISKFNSDGNLSWARQLQGSSGAAAVKPGPGGSVLVAGSFSGTCDFDPGAGVTNLSALNEDGFVLKLDSTGNFAWVKEFNGATASTRTFVNDFAIDDFGNVIATGTFQGQTDFDPGAGTFNLTTPDVHQDSFVTKLDSDGNFVWTQSLSGEFAQSAWEIDLDIWGRPVVAGTFIGTADFDPGVGNFAMTTLNSDGFVWKLDADGAFMWAKQVGGDNAVSFNEMRVDSQGSIYLVGNFGGTIDFNPGIAISTLASNGISDAFALKLNATGGYVWVRQFGGAQNDEAWGIALDPGYHILVTGTFRQTVDFDPRGGIYNLTSVGSTQDAFAVKLTQNLIFRAHPTARQLTLRKSGTQIQIADDSTGSAIVSRFAVTYLGVQIGGVSVHSDRLTVDFDYGGSMVLPAGVTFNGGSGGADSIRFVGTTFEDVSNSTGAIDGRAQLSVRNGPDMNTTISVSNVEGAKISGCHSLNYRTLGSDDLLSADADVSDSGASAMRINGTSEGVINVPLILADTTTVVFDLALLDSEARPNDSIALHPGSLSARGLRNLTVDTGYGEDFLSVESADLRLADPTGEFRFLPGEGLDTLVAQGDTDFNLNSSRLSSGVGGRLVFDNLERASLTGGPSANALIATGFNGSVELFGLEGNDLLRGTANDDRIFGGMGNDKIFGGRGNDFLRGDEGADTFYFDGTNDADDLRLIRDSAVTGYFNRYQLGFDQLQEQDEFNYDLFDKVEIRALNGDDQINVDLVFAISGTVNGGDGLDSCVAPSSWTKISC
jgi:RTX calcium-binding nonapeptide repeat (4 copies)